MTTQIEPGCLAKLIEKTEVKIVDGSWALDGTDMHALFIAEHIAGASFFDLDSISDHSTSLPHMAPSPAQFAEAVGQMGISETDHVVIYDRQGLFSAARVWWTFKLMGHEKVQVLRGGLPAWKACALPVTSEVPTVVPTLYKANFNSKNVIDINSLRDVIKALNALILDARPNARFNGIAPEPRAGLRAGHMPGSHNLPYGELIHNGALKPRNELEAIFRSYGVDVTKSIVTTCGSGVTAAIITMALEEAGYHSTQLYDGSWAEWGQTILDTPVVSET